MFNVYTENIACLKIANQKEKQPMVGNQKVGNRIGERLLAFFLFAFLKDQKKNDHNPNRKTPSPNTDNYCCNRPKNSILIRLKSRLLPYSSKEMGETALLRSLLESFEIGDVLVCDRLSSSSMMITLLYINEDFICTHLNASRQSKIIKQDQINLLIKSEKIVTWKVS